jgi:hypothetical protein
LQRYLLSSEAIAELTARRGQFPGLSASVGYITGVSHPSFAPPPGFDELSTDAKVDYVNLLWERVFVHDNPQSPDWHRDLVRAELQAQQDAPDATEDWTAARQGILDRIRQPGQ